MTLPHNDSYDQKSKKFIVRLNSLRKRNGLPPVNLTRKITPQIIREVTLSVWQKYPQALTDPNYKLGELTLDLVAQEVETRLDDIRRGVTVGVAALKDYFN